MYGRLVHAGLQGAYESARDEPGRGPTMAAYYPEAAAAIEDYADRDPIMQRTRREAAIAVEALLAALPTPAAGAVLAVELPFTIVVNGVTIRGVIDLALQTSAISVHIRDWKTGELPESIGIHPQMGVYHRAGRALWVFATHLTVGLYNTRRREERDGTFSAETETFVVDRLVSHYRNAMAAGEAVRHGRRSVVEAYPTTPGPNCSRCDYRSYCPLFASLVLPVRDADEVRLEGARILRLINQD